MAKVLSCWKDIARYLDRGVRTVQRWEQEQGLPVHRIGTGPRAPVFAFESELMAWLVSRTISCPDAREIIPVRATPPHSKWQELRARHQELMERNRQLASDQVLKLGRLLETMAVTRNREQARPRPAA